ncbi:PREDICTED: F-box/LRR-repeat protein At2g43260-like [Brassica oleracea var. oleracea]|uniref:F-box/LRR-repeat protein At2g43260-like n=1 Tax=Brassica oleracea var. oleracea TaxID=109376 RepID=UPI0006A6D913|nr:PREDICTED: F-box/LRR-repeat protein At2g43260-like [Brassica oleracea var. oleracea]
MNIIINTDLLEELLVRLPLKSLVRFKSVSKEWKSILESKCFVEKHLNFQKSTPKILIAYNCDCGVSPTLLPESRLEEGEEFVFLHCDATRSSMSCDGLVCIPEEECVNVLNLSTGQLQRFHSPPLVNRRTNSTFTNGTWTTYFPGYYAMGFGREKVKGHYKVVRISGDPNYSDTLDVSTGEWRTLWKPRRYKVDVGRKSACVNGTIYWLRIVSHGVNGSVYSILALDLHTEKFHYVKHLHLPKGIVLEAHIVNVGDRLVIAMPERNFFGGVELGIWSMDAAQEETWSKTHSISIGIKPGVESRSFTPLSVYLPKYYQDTDQLRPFSSDICAVCPYLESLVPLQPQQVEFSTRVTCIRIRRPTDEIQSRRAGKFLRKGIYVGAALWKNKWIAMYLIMCCFGTRGAVFRAAMLLLVCLISRSGYLLYIIVFIVLLRIYAIVICGVTSFLSTIL